ncbi:TetR/AcrR family transcriptional regulator [Arthrobacter russicus]|uniref:AcrR family transcriptional regulator n=1 Tax=Arthrobacter russicus TaxID=172040 RepID=A0ABU1JF73_9MICC|nr:TetR/AcrR family transcriptional regulator [Arthrobacter russicus]MBQ1442325.1 TetR/AcrR family transcriptional regulator [Renibacterium sp.]MDR6271018.1 AcrR family transcriptional regulator [Arthrobacter russicus]
MIEESGPGGRPRSEKARVAVLHAVDDLLGEVGYAAMNMKGIAERAGVSRMTVYRWWSTKAEILFEASVIDAEQELAVSAEGSAAEILADYSTKLVRFLTESAAGAAYRALVGEAQHDQVVAELISSNDVLRSSARKALLASGYSDGSGVPLEQACGLLVGPVFFWAMSGRLGRVDIEGSVAAFRRAVGSEH